MTLGDEDDMFDLAALVNDGHTDAHASPGFDLQGVFAGDGDGGAEAFFRMLGDCDDALDLQLGAPATPPGPARIAPAEILIPPGMVGRPERAPTLALLGATPAPPPGALPPAALPPVASAFVHPDSIEHVIPDGGRAAAALGLGAAPAPGAGMLGPPPRLGGVAARPRTPVAQGTALVGDAASADGARRGPKLRYSKGAAPSKYCHVCGRSSKTVSVALCGNNLVGLCRKVVCDKCLLMHQRDSWELAKTPGSDWICMHCKSECPDRARCHQYQRNNLKRRLAAGGGSDARVAKPKRGGGTRRTTGRPPKSKRPARARALPGARAAQKEAEKAQRIVQVQAAHVKTEPEGNAQLMQDGGQAQVKEELFPELVHPTLAQMKYEAAKEVDAIEQVTPEHKAAEARPSPHATETTEGPGPETQPEAALMQPS